MRTLSFCGNTRRGRYGSAASKRLVRNDGKARDKGPFSRLPVCSPDELSVSGGELFQEIPVNEADAGGKVNTGLPPEGKQARAVQEFTRGPVGLGIVPQDFALVTNNRLD